jgi:hypothetical protein
MAMQQAKLKAVTSEGLDQLAISAICTLSIADRQRPTREGYAVAAPADSSPWSSWMASHRSQANMGGEQKCPSFTGLDQPVAKSPTPRNPGGIRE